METANLSQLTYNKKITMTHNKKNNFLWNTKGCREIVEENNKKKHCVWDREEKKKLKTEKQKNLKKTVFRNYSTNTSCIPSQ